MIAVLAASGPSFTQEQADLIEAARAAGKIHVGVVNRTWERLPNADVLYAADAKWWDAYIESVRAGFNGECWTQDEPSARKYGLCHVRGKGLPGLSRDKTLIHNGGNSGYALVNLARHFGTELIVLVGYDMQHGATVHWHPDYPKGWGNANSPQAWAPRFTQLYADLTDDGIKVVNCSTETAITAIPRADLASVLETL